jgi:2-polyprenyl-6-methoxyphenol hydroxylase-like FAD-dependent oxidoreductase
MARHVVVIGGSIAGLATSLALARRGHRVTVFEKDAAPLPATPEEAFRTWHRRGSPQVLQSHAFLGRMHNLIRDREPELLRELLDAGAEQLTFRKQALQYFDAPEFEPEDDDIVLLACRRVTFEWVLRKHILETGLVEFRDGIGVEGLVAEPDAATGSPRVTGVALRSAGPGGETCPGDLVVDASGRRTKLADWLVAIGAPRLREESKPCGIFYASRFYRLHEGAGRPSEDGIIGGDLGYVKFGIFPGDRGTFSLTLAAAPDDAPMRALLRNRGFDCVARSLPTAWEWVRPEVSAPITDVQGMANLRNTRRHLVENGEPLALGIIAIGDSLVHANPITGRGCSLAWISAYALADGLEKQPNDLRALALELESVAERELRPWLDAQLRQDQDAIEVNETLRRGGDPYLVERPDGTRDPKAYMRSVLREGLAPAIRQDLGLMRRFLRVGHMLESPQDLIREPEVMKRILAAYESRHEREPLVRGPSRAEMLELLEAA